MGFIILIPILQAGPSKKTTGPSLPPQPTASTSSDPVSGEKKRKQAVSDEQDLREAKKARKNDGRCMVSLCYVHAAQFNSIVTAKKTSKATKATAPESSVEKRNTLQTGSEKEEEEDAEVEPRVLTSVHRESDEEGANSSDPDDEGDPSKLVHESLLKGKKGGYGGSSSKRKYVPSEETPERRNARTIFVGNVPAEVAKSRVCSFFAKNQIVCSLSYMSTSPSKSNSSAFSAKSTMFFARSFVPVSSSRVSVWPSNATARAT